MMVGNLNVTEFVSRRRLGGSAKVKPFFCYNKISLRAARSSAGDLLSYIFLLKM